MLFESTAYRIIPSILWQQRFRLISLWFLGFFCRCKWVLVLWLKIDFNELQNYNLVFIRISRIADNLFDQKLNGKYERWHNVWFPFNVSNRDQHNISTTDSVIFTNRQQNVNAWLMCIVTYIICNLSICCLNELNRHSISLASQQIFEHSIWVKCQIAAGVFVCCSVKPLQRSEPQNMVHNLNKN